jgi:hypothetical protein
MQPDRARRDQPAHDHGDQIAAALAARFEDASQPIVRDLPCAAAILS